MRQGIGRPSPALVISLIALFVALSGTVYAATKINGRLIKVKSLPGNRLKPGSVPGNRLRPGTISGTSLAPGSVTGAQIDLSTLGQVPSALNAASADSATSAQTAIDAQHAGDALTAVSAVVSQHADNATTVNGHTVQCYVGTTPFLGACWENSPAAGAVTAPTAATNCANSGGVLPEAFQLYVFLQKSGIDLDSSAEWSSDIPVVTGLNLYGVVTVSDAGINTTPASDTKKYRCVYPLVS
jgi:hypothetical protein